MRPAVEAGRARQLKGLGYSTASETLGLSTFCLLHSSFEWAFSMYRLQSFLWDRYSFG